VTVAFGSVFAAGCATGLDTGRWKSAVIAACGLLCWDVAQRLKAPRPRMAASASRGVDEPEDLAERLVERLGERVVRLRAAIVCLLFESRWGDATNCSFAFGYRGLPPVLPERCPSAARALRRQQKTPLSRRFEAGWQDLLVARRLMIAGGLAGS